MATLAAVDIAAMVYIALTILGLIFVYFILKRIIRKIAELWAKGSLFGGDVKTRLISLGIVALLFPSMFFSIGSAIISFIGNFYVDVPLSLFSNWQANQSFCSDYDPNFRPCIAQLGYGFVQAWTSALSDSLNRFGPGDIPYGRLVLMLAVWAGVALFLSTASPKEKDIREGAEPKTRLQSFIDRLSPTTKQNIMFFAILVLAGYLSVAAIAAIPGLEETAVPSEAVSVERLEQQLQDALTESMARIPQQMDFSKPIAVPTGPGTPTATPDGIAITVSTNAYDDFLKIQRQQWSTAYAKLREDVQAQAENSKTSAISAYRASVIVRKGTKETIQHFLDIEAWFRQELNRMETQVADCRRRLVNVESMMNSFLTSEDPSTLSSAQILQNADQDAREACQTISVTDPVPQRQDLGSNMGPFSYIASWLLRTESLPLAQIVGLLGFGLLGSAVSSLVRKNGGHSKDQPLVEELATVIIRGATAAVVVFLAVKGGLAIFTSGESNANSYVLLLTCLVAAVFSEDVWAEAHTRLNKGLSGGEEQPAVELPPAPEPETPTPAKPITVTPAPEENKTREDDSNQMPAIG